MLAAGLDESLDHGHQERSCAAGRLDRHHRGEVSVGREAGQVEDQFDDPTAGEDLAMLAGLVDLKHLRTRSFVQVEAHLAPRCQTGSTHRGALQKLVAAADRGRDQTRPGGEPVPGDHLLLEAEIAPWFHTLHAG